MQLLRRRGSLGDEKIVLTDCFTKGDRLARRFYFFAAITALHHFLAMDPDAVHDS
jgi:hypothetical protein